jgi:hypothetical protein
VNFLKTLATARLEDVHICAFSSEAEPFHHQPCMLPTGLNHILDCNTCQLPDQISDERCMHILCHLCTDISKYLCVFCTPDNSQGQMQKNQNTDLSWRRSSLVLSAISRTTCCSDKLSFSASCTIKTAISLWVFVIVMLSTQNNMVPYVITYSGNLL